MNYRVVFPASVRWMSLEFDPRCSTAQQEDVLQIFIKNSTKNNGQHPSLPNKTQIVLTTGNLFTHFSVCVNKALLSVILKKIFKSLLLIVKGEADIPPQKFRSVLKKFSGGTNWPQQSVILPGNEILFSLETASYYVKDSKVLLI